MSLLARDSSTCNAEEPSLYETVPAYIFFLGAGPFRSTETTNVRPASGMHIVLCSDRFSYFKQSITRLIRLLYMHVTEWHIHLYNWWLNQSLLEQGSCVQGVKFFNRSTALSLPPHIFRPFFSFHHFHPCFSCSNCRFWILNNSGLERPVRGLTSCRNWPWLWHNLLYT